MNQNPIDMHRRRGVFRDILRVVVLAALTMFSCLVASVSVKSFGEQAESRASAKAARKKPAPKKPNAAKNSPDDALPIADDDPDSPAPPIEYETIKLTDGTELKVEKWNETYHTFEYRPPLNADDWFDPDHRPPADPRIETVIDGADRSLRFDGPPGWAYLRLDPKRNRMYWIASANAHPVGKILRSNLNGKDIKFLVEKLVDPRELTLDLKKDKMYWVEFPNELTERGIRSASINGGKSEKVLVGLEAPGAMVIDTDQQRLLFAETKGGTQRRILEVNFDGTGQRIFVDKELAWSMDADFSERTLYWAQGNDCIKRMSMAGGPVETVLDLDPADAKLGERTFSKISGIAYDPIAKKMYWSSNFGSMYRANIDGSQPEHLVKVGAGPPSLDTQHGYIYWAGGRSIGGNLYPRIQRIKLRPPLKRLTKNAPPFITEINPLAQGPGATIVVKGSGFKGATRVAFSDNDAGKHVHAKFEVISDSELLVTIPMLNAACGAAPITVLTPNGVTVTLPLDLTAYNFNPNRGGGVGFDRLTCQKRDVVCWVNEHAWLTGHERAVAFVVAKGRISGNAAGGTTHFLKNGAMTGVSETVNSVIYHEPFALIEITHYVKPNQVEFVPVPGIRASFVPRLFEYMPK